MAYIRGQDIYVESAGIMEDLGKALIKDYQNFTGNDCGRRQAKQGGRGRTKERKPQKPFLGPHRQEQDDVVVKDARRVGRYFSSVRVMLKRQRNA